MDRTPLFLGTPPMTNPLRMLQGISYWVIDEPKAIYDYLNKNIRLEWEKDATDEGRNLENDSWLQTLSDRKWTLETLQLNEIKLNPKIMNYRNESKMYDFQIELSKRRSLLRKSVEYGNTIWPLIVDEKLVLRDGYCRYTTLAEIGVSQAYCYLARLAK